jgi:hypothetical protein
MVKDVKGCNIGVECLGIAMVVSLDEDLDAMLSGLVGFVESWIRAAQVVLAQTRSMQEASALIAKS